MYHGSADVKHKRRDHNGPVLPERNGKMPMCYPI